MKFPGHSSLVLMIITGLVLVVTASVIIWVSSSNEKKDQSLQQIPSSAVASPSNSPSSSNSTISTFKSTLPKASPSSTPGGIVTECHQNAKYYIVVGGESGSRAIGFIVKYKTNPQKKLTCSYQVEEGDYEIKQHFAEFYEALVDDYLLFDSGTGPGLRGLIVYDLQKRQKVFSDSYESGVEKPLVIEGTSVEYWASSDRGITTQNCPEAKKWESELFGVKMRQKVKLDLKTLSKDSLGVYKCFPTQ